MNDLAIMCWLEFCLFNIGRVKITYVVKIFVVDQSSIEHAFYRLENVFYIIQQIRREQSLVFYILQISKNP